MLLHRYAACGHRYGWRSVSYDVWACNAVSVLILITCNWLPQSEFHVRHVRSKHRNSQYSFQFLGTWAFPWQATTELLFLNYTCHTIFMWAICHQFLKFRTWYMWGTCRWWVTWLKYMWVLVYMITLSKRHRETLASSMLQSVSGLCVGTLDTVSHQCTTCCQLSGVWWQHHQAPCGSRDVIPLSTSFGSLDTDFQISFTLAIVTNRLFILYCSCYILD